MAAAKQHETSLARTRGDDFPKRVIETFDAFIEALKSTPRWSRMQRMVAAYYSETDGDDTEIQEGGDDGELTLMKPNQLRNLIQHQLNLVTQTPPGYEAAAATADADALEQVSLARSILDHYLRVERLDQERVRRAEMSLVTSESWLHAPWDAMRGRVWSTDGKKEVHEGDFSFELVPPWRCAYDWLSKLSRPREAILKVPRNRWDLIATHPKHKAAILAAEPWCDAMDAGDKVDGGLVPEDYVAVLYYYADRSPDAPKGRAAQILDSTEGVVLEDADLAEKRVPAFRLAPCERMTGPGGHTNNFDLLPLNEAYQAQLSTILSNHTTLGNQLIAIEKGSGVKPHHLGRGLTALEYERGRHVPMALNLLATPKEVPDFAQTLKREMETLAAISASNRGEASSATSSGSKEALLHSAAQQFATSFHQALLRSDEDLGQHIIDAMKVHARTERLIVITGKAQSHAARKFTTDELKHVHLVTVRAPSAIRDTPMGRYESAKDLMKLKNGIETAAQYMTFQHTGRLEELYEGDLSEMILIRREGEELRDMKLEAPIVAPTDLHALHVTEHRALYADPQVRRGGKELVARIWAHIQAHENALTPGHPEYAGDGVLLMTGQKPLPAPQPPAPPGGGAGGGPIVRGPAGPVPGGPGPSGPRTPDGPGGPGVAPGMPPLPKLPIIPTTGERVAAPMPGAAGA